jgi:SAM-dependent methyltransferase
MESDFKDLPISVHGKDYWRQVKRTVNGVPVSEEQIEMIVNAVCRGLDLDTQKHDTLLDLGCGNGALSQLLFGKVKEFYGVDYSDYLISIAKRDFEISPKFCFDVGDVLQYLNAEMTPKRFTKVLCYGCFSYFPEAESCLSVLHDRFTKVEQIFIGNLPDRDRAHLFYWDGLPAADELLNYDSKIGIWRNEAEFAELARRANWSCHFSRMPESFYANHYRYDVTLTRRDR